MTIFNIPHDITKINVLNEKFKFVESFIKISRYSKCNVLSLREKRMIVAAVGVVGMCVNCQNCEAVGKLFADLWKKACLFPSGCE